MSKIGFVVRLIAVWLGVAMFAAGILVTAWQLLAPAGWQL